MPGPPVELPWSLFHGLWLHSLAVAVQGGAAIGVVIGLGFGPPGMIVVGSLGTFAGVILGSVYGLVVGMSKWCPPIALRTGSFSPNCSARLIPSAV